MGGKVPLTTDILRFDKTGLEGQQANTRDEEQP